MFIKSRKTRSAIYHHDQCRYAKLIKAENIVYAHKQSEFTTEGFEECAFCGKLKIAMRRIARIAADMQHTYCLTYDLRDDALYVLTNLSAWKIIVEEGGLFALYHQNGYQRPRGHGAIPYRMRDYHDQGIRLRKGIHKLLKYIVNHDTRKTDIWVSEEATHKKPSRINKTGKTSIRHNKDHRRRLQTHAKLDMIDQIDEYIHHG